MWVSLPTESGLGGVATIFKMTQALQSPSFGEVIFQGDGWLITPRGCETCRWLRCHLTHSLLWIQLRRAVVPNLLGTRGWFHRRQSFMDQGRGGWFWNDSSASHLLCTLFLLLYQLYRRSSASRSQRLGTPDLEHQIWLLPEAWQSCSLLTQRLTELKWLTRTAHQGQHFHLSPTCCCLQC